MGKRLVKIRKSEILSKKDILKGKEADVILNTKATLHGYINSIESDTALVDDKKGTVHKVLLVNIEEIIYDLQAPF